jgi:hypothetical protein
VGSGVGRSHHPVQRDDRRDRGAATRLATTGAATRHRSRNKYRARRETFGCSISDDGAVDFSATIRDGEAIDYPATISDDESARIADARTERCAFEDTGALVRTGRRGSVFG